MYAKQDQQEETDGERILRPLKLTEDEIDDLVAFLESLSPILPVPAPGKPETLPACAADRPSAKGANHQ